MPLGGGVGRIFRLGSQPMNAQVQGFHYVESPSVELAWSLRVPLQFLFPKQPASPGRLGGPVWPRFNKIALSIYHTFRHQKI